MKDEIKTGINVLIAILIIIVLWWGVAAGMASYGVWSQRKHGEAELARAQSNRQIKTLEAKALEDSAGHFSNAEIIRAKGVAEANKIIGSSLSGNEAYLRYLWIQGLQTNQMQTIYIPTEANLPILEASRDVGNKNPSQVQQE